MRLTDKSKRAPIYTLWLKEDGITKDKELSDEIFQERKLRCDIYNKLHDLEDIEDELGIDLIAFLEGTDADTCFMEITKDKKFYFCGDAYYGEYTKEDLLKLIQELLFMYHKLTKEF